MDAKGTPISHLATYKRLTPDGWASVRFRALAEEVARTDPGAAATVREAIRLDRRLDQQIALQIVAPG
jgi:hypothetical protein